MTSQPFGIAKNLLPDGVGSNRSPCIKVGGRSTFCCAYQAKIERFSIRYMEYLDSAYRINKEVVTKPDMLMFF